MKAKVRTCLLIRGQAEEAARFYVSLIPGSVFEGAFRPLPDMPVLMAEFTLAGTPYQVLGDGPPAAFTEATSISVITKDQAETDRLWTALTEGGAESYCGWLKDRYGLSWQIVPEALPRLFSDPDRAAAGRAMQAMFTMRKIDIAALEGAFKG